MVSTDSIYFDRFIYNTEPTIFDTVVGLAKNTHFSDDDESAQSTLIQAFLIIIRPDANSMSFLAQIEDREHAQTLEATLAFLEEALSGAFGSGGDASGSDASGSDASASSTSGSFDESSQLPVASLSQLQQQRKATTIKRPRVETRMKIRQLQEQAAELQVRLQQLRARPPGAKPTLRAAAEEGTLLVSLQPQRKKSRTSPVASLAQTSIWLDQVVEQYNKLQKAQALNQKLKDAAKKQVAVCKSLITHLHKKAPLEVRVMQFSCQ
jgi:hypothetical protein